MEHVYVALRFRDDETTDLLGVTSDQEKAKKLAESHYRMYYSAYAPALEWSEPFPDVDFVEASVPVYLSMVDTGYRVERWEVE